MKYKLGDKRPYYIVLLPGMMQQFPKARLFCSRSLRFRAPFGKRRLVQGLSAALASAALGGLMLYKGIQALQQKLSVTSHSDVVELEKAKHAAYIYIPREDDGSDTDRSHGLDSKTRTKTKPWFSWVQSHSHDPRTLLRLTQSDDHSVRLLGVQALAQQHHWHGSQYMLVAQACDHRTLVGLARSPNIDPRFFLPPPPLPVTEEFLEDDLRRLLGSLPTTGVDKCTGYFTSHALAEGKVPAEERESIWTIDGSDVMREVAMNTISTSQRAKMFCLQAIYSHSTVASHCKKIVHEGGLQLLHRIYATSGRSIKVCRNIARILANTSLDAELHGDLLNAGWVTILAEWINSPDLALSMLAAKALANLDRDYGELKLYEDAVHLYYPKHRYSEPVYVDVVFVHGLLGGPFRTWRQKDPAPVSNKTIGKNNGNKKSPDDAGMKNSGTGPSVGNTNVAMETDPSGEYTSCWPKDWLAKDCPHMRIITVEYDTHLSEWAPKCPFESEKRSLAARSSDILSKLHSAGIGERPVIWVGHSMGGLLIKKMLVMAKENPMLHRVVEETKGLVFYSVPHQGSPLAARSAQAKYVLYPSVEVTELSQGSAMLQKLHTAFTELMFETDIPLLSFGEGRKSDLPFNLKLMIVPTESSNPGFGEYHVLENMNHLEICKPVSRDSPLYTLTRDFITSCVPHHLVEHILRANMPEEFILQDMMN